MLETEQNESISIHEIDLVTQKSPNVIKKSDKEISNKLFGFCPNKNYDRLEDK